MKRIFVMQRPYKFLYVVDKKVLKKEPNPPTPFPSREGGAYPLFLQERGRGKGERSYSIILSGKIK